MAETMKNSVWDCGSNLYDSFEKRSFERQLDSAISSRSYSMPHERFAPLTLPKNPPTLEGTKKSSVASKSIIRKLLRSVFRVKLATDLRSDSSDSEGDANHDLHQVSSRLPTIPETREKDYGSSLIGKSVSERFTITASRISCP